CSSYAVSNTLVF
nr:immunoglobulin light chain junction region [Macaca mulatta]